MAGHTTMDVDPVTDFEVSRLTSEADVHDWNDCLSRSANATLFHRLEFLSYHPPDRFDFHHILIRQGGKPVAVVPGAVHPEFGFQSPVGASVGGPAIARKVRLGVVCSMVSAMQDYAERQGWSGVDFTIAPSAYHDPPHQLVEFALHRTGFSLHERWACLMIAIEDSAPNRFERLFVPQKRTAVRSLAQQGLEIREAGPEGLADFLPLLKDTFERHGSQPTHSEDEIQDLMNRCHDEIRLWFAYKETVPIAALLVFLVTPQVCSTFYICDDSDYRHIDGVTAALIAGLLDKLAERGVRFLDLGPSASTGHFNEGVVHFKQLLGAQPYCRDRWVWKPS